MADYTKQFGEQTFRFRRPNLDQVDRYLKAGNKGLSKASGQLCLDIVVPEDRDAWVAALQTKPGFAVQVANMALQDLGYAGDDVGE